MIVFDVDGTILPGTSCERLFVRHLVERRILRWRHFINFCIRGIELLPSGFYFMTKANKGYLRSFDVAEMTRLGRSFFEEHLAGRISRAAIVRIEEHQARGKRIVLFSGMPDFLLRNFAEYLNVTEFYGSVTEMADGRFTGRTLGPFPLAQGKVAALEPILSREHILWQEVTFYADHYLDRFLLARVGHPVAVNPRPRLAALARENNWTLEWWD